MLLSHAQTTAGVSDRSIPAVLYAERLHPSLGVWAASAFVPLTAVFIFLPIAPLAGILLAIALAIATATFWFVSTVRISITEETLYAGKASIERRYLGPAEGYRHGEATAERGVNLNGKAHLLLRGWIDPVIKIKITDTKDPHPYWLLSTRHPEAIAQVLNNHDEG